MRFQRGILLLASTLLLLALALPVLAMGGDGWLSDARKVKKIQPPLKRTMYAGEVARIKLVKDQALLITVDDDGKGGGLIALPSRKGERVGEKRVITGEKPEIFYESLEEADEISIRVFAGELDIQADINPMEERKVKEGETVEFVIQPFRQVRGRFINLSDYRSVVSYEFYSGEGSISKSSERDRTTTLDFKHSSRDKTWKSAADRMVVRVKKGEVLIKVGQPFQYVR